MHYPRYVYSTYTIQVQLYIVCVHVCMHACVDVFMNVCVHALMFHALLAAYIEYTPIFQPSLHVFRLLPGWIECHKWYIAQQTRTYVCVLAVCVRVHVRMYVFVVQYTIYDILSIQEAI